MADPESNELPPNVFAQIKFPKELNLTTNTSCPPTAVLISDAAPGSKSTDPLKSPVMYTL